MVTLITGRKPNQSLYSITMEKSFLKEGVPFEEPASDASEGEVEMGEIVI